MHLNIYVLNVMYLRKKILNSRSSYIHLKNINRKQVNCIIKIRKESKKSCSPLILRRGLD